MDEDHLTTEEAALLDEIRSRRRKLVATHRRSKSAANNAPVMPRTADAQRGRTTDGMKVWTALLL
jgi:nucleolar GTP-binding protein